jgi:hypothetical protein
MSNAKAIEAIRSVKVGPFGPNALAIINAGGSISLTYSEAERIYSEVARIMAATNPIDALDRLIAPAQSKTTAPHI